MNIKKQIKLKKIKAFTLAGLMGLAGCRANVEEPDAPKEKAESTEVNTHTMPSSQPTDSFMQHVSDIDNTRLYQPTEDTHYFFLQTDPLTHNVTNIIEKRDVKDNNYSIMNTYNLKRIGNTCINGSANFVTENYWRYDVETEDEKNWSIECVPEAEYNNKYSNMSDTALAEIARNRILKVNSEDQETANTIYQSILNKRGNWQQEEPFYATFNSKGNQQNLKHSDFGTFDVTIQSQSFTNPYSGGVKAQEIPTSSLQAQTFKATAFGNVAYDDHNGSEGQMAVSTGLDSAIFTIDAYQNETIVMPFKNWYTVTIIRTNNSVVSQFEDKTGNVAQQWQALHQNTPETNFRSGTQDNGLDVKDGLWGTSRDNSILTGTSVTYYTDETGYIEFVGQGYRQDRNQNQKQVFTFCFGGTNRPKTEEQVPTGLDIVYATQQRQR